MLIMLRIPNNEIPLANRTAFSINKTITHIARPKCKHTTKLYKIQQLRNYSNFNHASHAFKMLVAFFLNINISPNRNALNIYLCHPRCARVFYTPLGTSHITQYSWIVTKRRKTKNILLKHSHW